jgi:hypothetical protein
MIPAPSNSANINIVQSAARRDAVLRRFRRSADRQAARQASSESHSYDDYYVV